MASWTLRPQKHHGERRTSSAALRAKRYVRRHANEFHGAGVEEAVLDLTAFAWASQKARDAVAQLVSGFQVPAELESDGTPLEPYGLCPDCKGPNLAPGLVHQCPVDRVPETAHGLTVVGWHDTTGKVFCLEHREPGYAPLTAAGLPVPADCYECGSRLLVPDPALTALCLCTHPYSRHNANGLCIALPGVLGCGCMGWSEAQS